MPIPAAFRALRGSVQRTGLDPDDLPEADKSKMNFGSGGNAELKAWRDIWSAGQGVANIRDILPAGQLVTRMIQEYEETRGRMCAAV